MREIAVITPNWNGGDLAVQSAQSVVKQSVSPKLFVIENGSADGSGAAIARACPDVELIQNAKNLGYAAAINQGLRVASDFEYTLLLNNDVVFRTEHDFVKPLEYLQRNPSVQAVCGRYEHPDGRFQGFYHGLPTPLDLATYWGFGRHVPGAFSSPSMRRFLCADFDFSRPGELEQPGFTCVLCRTSALRHVGDLDEQFPIFFNDVDYCWRWRKRGWNFHYLPEWQIVHHQSTSTGKLGSKIYAEMAGSISRFAAKHYSRRDAAIVRASLAAEAAYRRVRHHDFDSSIAGVWRGDLVFLRP
ncbi:MAG TPA: glycosyltransferase family 2 protein [Polyangiaceae bacterium]|nr:glycosyltransferase family 2 protein [Polyangiaceae bacterium]